MNEMKKVILALLLSLAASGCGYGSRGEVEFEWYNLGTNEIYVTEVIGLPLEATPGRLGPVLSEDRLHVASSVLFESIRIKDQLTILWKDNGKEGWPGGVEPPGSEPRGTAHRFELKRDDLGIPAKVKVGTIRFTYLGDNKWRVKLL